MQIPTQVDIILQQHFNSLMHDSYNTIFCRQTLWQGMWLIYSLYHTLQAETLRQGMCCGANEEWLIYKTMGITRTDTLSTGWHDDQACSDRAEELNSTCFNALLCSVYIEKVYNLFDRCKQWTQGILYTTPELWRASIYLVPRVRR